MQDPAFRTDLAMEAREAAGEIPGVEMTKEQDAGAEIVRVRPCGRRKGPTRWASPWGPTSP